MQRVISPANGIAVPLTSFWVMPWAVIAVLAMPFGLEAWPLQVLARNPQDRHAKAL